MERLTSREGLAGVERFFVKSLKSSYDDLGFRAKGIGYRV